MTIPQPLQGDGLALSAERAPDPAPVSFSKLYDMQTLRPCQALVDQYRKFTRIFRDLGLEYPTWTD